MTQISRRHVVKGAAWTAPAVVVAGSAPALAASDPNVPTCPAVPQLVDITGGKSHSASLAGATDANPTHWDAEADAWGQGQNLTVALGVFTFARPAGTNYTGLRMVMNTADLGIAPVVRTFFGTTSEGVVNGSASNTVALQQSPTTAQALTTLPMGINIDTDLPYHTLRMDWDRYNVRSISFPVRFEWLVGLSDATPACEGVYWLNYCYESAGNVSNNGYAYSLTSAPEQPC